MHNSLISTALLALQQSSQVQFIMSSGPDETQSGFFFKGYANEDEDDEIQLQVFVYVDKKSPTGYGVSVDAVDDETNILNQSIESFEEFQRIFHSDYIQNVFNNHYS